jgi:exoribonuclease-2
MGEYEGKIIEFTAKDHVHQGFVLKQVKDRLLVCDERARETTVSLAKVVLAVDPSPPAGRTPAEIVQKWRSDVEAVRREIDLPLLWEIAVEQPRDYDLADLSALYFARATPVQQSALFHALMEDDFYFKRVGTRFKPRTRDQVREEEQRRENERRKEAFRHRAREWLREVLASAESCDVPPEFAELVDRIEDFLLRRQGGQAVALLWNVHEDMTPREVAYEVLVKVGRLDAATDPLVIISGLRPEFPPDALQAADALAPFSGDDARRDFTSAAAFAIDDEETEEVDDAFTVELSDDGVRLGIHIADVSHFVRKGDPLDCEASQRAVTVYLPTRRVPMLPERLAFDLASLQEGTLRPVISFVVECDARGNIRQTEIEPGVVRISRRLTYEEADRVLASSGDSRLAWLYRFAQQRLAWRREEGSLLIRRPEIKVRVSDGEIHLKRLDPQSPSRMIVSEMMVLANWLAAKQATISDLPIIYRAQDPPAEPIDPAVAEAVGRTYDPIVFEKVVKLIRRSKLSLMPQRHAGLGLSAYTQLTSPIRRFADLVMQRQIMALIRGEDPPYERGELLEVLATVEAVERDIRALEARAAQYWILEFLRRQPPANIYQGIVVRRMPGYYLVELSDFLVRGILRTMDSLDIGQQIAVTVAAVNPRKGLLQVARAD